MPGSGSLSHAGSGAGNLLHDPHDAFDDVVDVGEVPLHASVVEDLDGVALQNGPREQEQRHVRPSPGTVHGEEPQPRAAADR